MKRLFIWVILVLCFNSLWSQFDYGNNWYDPSQSYIKLRVAKDGIYRVTAAELNAAGFNTSGVNPNLFQLYYRGKQEYIYVDETGGILNFIEFYGRRNDGRVDSTMFVDGLTNIHDPDAIADIEKSYFTDTSAYFLTIGTVPGLRFTTYTNNIYTGTPEPYIRSKVRKELITYAYPYKGGGYSYDPNFELNCEWTMGEGYNGQGFSNNGAAVFNVSTPFAFNDPLNPAEVSFRIHGYNAKPHYIETEVNSTVIYTDTFNSSTNHFQYITTVNQVFTGNITNNTTFRFEASGSPDYNFVFWAAVEYNRLPNMAGDSVIKVQSWNKAADTYLRFYNCAVNTEGYVYDLTNKVRISATSNADTLKAMVPGAANNRRLFVASDRGVMTPLIESPQLNNLSNTTSDANFIIITSKALASSAQAYELYRDTCTVNPHNARVVYVEDIYDEFGYGSITSLAIKRFCKYAIDNYSTTPDNFLLWGKGKKTTRNTTSNYVPVYGYPAADYLYVTDFDPMVPDYTPDVSIGRVNILNDQEGLDFLNKVNEYEHSPYEDWMKEGVFLGGGALTGEQQQIGNYLYGATGNTNSYKDQFEDFQLGGKGWYFQTVNNSITTNANFTSHSKINSGVGLIHFFGHSSANVVDVDIRQPENYTNWGKYPIMIAYGCYGGNFTGGESFGERFLKIPNRGVIAYIANSEAGFLHNLGEYGIRWYDVAFDANYGSSLGEIMRNTIANYLGFSNSQAYVNHAMQLNLQGDPALAIYHQDKPDLEITQQTIYFEPSNFSAQDTSFIIKVPTKNLGKVVLDSFYLHVKQVYPFNPQIPTDTTYTRLFPPVYFLDTLELTIPNTIGQYMTGLNQFDVFVDALDTLDESKENNNRVVFSYMVPGNVPIILFPKEFAVIDSNGVELSAATAIMTTNPMVYVYEIDTSHRFNSPMFRTASVQGTGSYSSWNVPFTLTDSTVYYWRVRLENVQPSVWATSSFKYIDNRVGWAQSRPPQFFKDPTERIEMNQVQMQWEFNNPELPLTVNAIRGTPASMFFGAFSSNLSHQAHNGVMFNSFDANTLEPYYKNGFYGDWDLLLMPAGEAALITAINNTKFGDYFLISSTKVASPNLWSQNMYNALKLIGASDKIQNLQATDPFIILGRKGIPGSAIEIFPQPGQNSVALQTTLTQKNDEGSITSTQIGPASAWHDLIWKWASKDAQIKENQTVTVWGVRADKTDSLIFSQLPAGSYSLSGIDPNRFPYMRLVSDARDSMYFTAPQLEHWHVIFDGLCDPAVDPVTNFVFNRDTVDEGEDVQVSLNVRNLTDVAADSLLVHYYIRRNSDNIIVSDDTVRYAPMPGKSQMTITHTMSTGYIGLAGDATLYIELNPFNDQVEEYKFNDFYEYQFHVRPDQTNPLLDVTFDGRRIMDGDIVSPKPEILIQINDENPYLAVNDTAYEVWFGKGRIESQLQQIYINGNPNIEVISAQLPENKAKIYFRPDKLEDGEYTLKIQGKDFRENEAGATEYKIHFEVVNESAVSHVLNYPNPFSSSTRFVYTLTGEHIPDVFRIDIYTVSGKLVKSIDLAELGDVHVGKNMTEYAWDGTDEFGDKLANGVYVYRVVTKVSGDQMDHRDENIDDYFSKNGYGKLVIMR